MSAIKARERIEAYLAERARVRRQDGLRSDAGVLAQQRDALLTVEDLETICEAVATGYELATLRERERIYEIVMRAPYDAAIDGESAELANERKSMAFVITMQIMGRMPPRELQPGAQGVLEFKRKETA